MSSAMKTTARLILALLFAVGVTACADETHRIKIDAGGGGSKYASTHFDTGSAELDATLYDWTGFMRGPDAGAARVTRQQTGHPLAVSAIGRFGIGHEHGGSSLVEYVGGIRLTNEKQFKYPIYGEFLAGWIHYNGFGESDFTIRPSAGIKFPLSNQKYHVYVQGGLPFVYFGFYHERGLEWQAGLEIPLQKKTP